MSSPALALWPLRLAVADALSAAMAASMPGAPLQVDGAAQDTSYPFWAFGPVTMQSSASDTSRAGGTYSVQLDVWGTTSPAASTPLVHEIADALYAAASTAGPDEDGDLPLSGGHGTALFLGLDSSALLADDDPATGAPLWHMALRLTYAV